jgi:hypothetical protein
MPEIATEVFLPGDRATIFATISESKRDIQVLQAEDKHFVKAIDNAIALAGKAIDDAKEVAANVNTLGMQFEALTGEIRSNRDAMEMGFQLLRQELKPTLPEKSGWSAFFSQLVSWKSPAPYLALAILLAIVAQGDSISSLIHALFSPQP